MYVGPDADDDSNYVLWVYPAGDEEEDVVCKIKQQKSLMYEMKWI